MSDIVSQVNNNLQVKEEIYGRLAKLPKEIADNIVSSKTSGGRCLNAILYGCPDLSPPQTLILIVLGSKMDFRGTFQDEYQFCSLNKIADTTKLSQRAVVNNLADLVQLGYVNKKVATISEQQIGHANHYCLTGKVFDSYLSAQIDKEEEKQFCATFGKKVRPVKMCKSPSDIANTPSAPDSDPLCTRFTTPSAPRADKFPSSSPSIKKEREETLSETSKSGTKTHEALADLLSHRLGSRFDNKRSKCLILASERSNTQIDAAIIFLSKFSQVFAKSDLSSDQSIIACLHAVIDADENAQAELMKKYVRTPAITSSVIKEEEVMMTDEQRKEVLNIFKAKFKKGA